MTKIVDELRKSHARRSLEQCWKEYDECYHTDEPTWSDVEEAFKTAIAETMIMFVSMSIMEGNEHDIVFRKLNNECRSRFEAITVRGIKNRIKGANK